MTATRGSWTLHQAVLRRWLDSGADQAIRGLWDAAKQSQFVSLHDEEARPRSPFPYVVLNIAEPQTRFKSSGRNATTELEYLQTGLQFECFAHDAGTPLTITSVHAAMLNAHFAAKGSTRTVTAGNLGGKPAAQLIAEIVALAFDNQRLTIENDSYVQTFRGPDFPVRQDDTHWSWVLRYSVQFEAEYLIAPTP